MPRTSRAAGATAAPSQPGAPRKQGRIRQMIEVFKQTQEIDRSTLPMMLVGLVVPIVLAVLLTWLIFHSPWYGLFVGLMIGVLVAMIILARKAERAAYGRIAGQQGAARAAMGSIRRGWNVENEPCAIDPRSQEMVFRASGRAGVALVVESTSGKAITLLRKEASRTEKLLQNVPVHQIVVSEEEGDIPLNKLAGHMMRLKPVLTKDEAAAVAQRLRAMPNPIRQAIPKGVDPMRARPNRRAMRGR